MTFGALSTVAGAQPREAAAADPERDRQIRDAARQFEALMIQQLTQVMRGTTPEMFSGAGGEMYGAMFDEAFGDAMSRSGGMGLADVIARAMGASETRAPELSQVLAPTSIRPDVDLGAVLEVRPATGAALSGATGALQQAADLMLPESGVATQWGRDGTLTTEDLASDFATVEPGGVARFMVRDIAGYQGYYKCNLFAMELARRAGFEVPVAAREHGWTYVGPTYLAQDAADGRVRGDWARVVTGASAEELDSSIVRGERAFLITGSGHDGHRGHMGVIERVHEVDYDAEGRITRIVFDGWEGRTTGAMHLTRRAWFLAGHGHERGGRSGFGSIELLELQRAAEGERAERPLHEHAGVSVRDGT